MGTPHRGCSRLALWGATISQVFKSGNLLGSIRLSLVRELRRRSKILFDISQEFIPSAEKLRIVSFYERNLTPKLRKIVCSLILLR